MKFWKKLCSHYTKKNLFNYDSREEQKFELKKLVRYLNDLQKTGLGKYNKPIRFQIRSGQTEVYDISEYSGTIREIIKTRYEIREASQIAG